MSKILSIYKFLFKRLWKLEHWLIFTMFFSVITLGITPALISFILKRILANIEATLFYTTDINSFNILITLCAIYILLMVVKEIMSMCQFALYNLVGVELTFDIQSLILKKIKEIPYGTFFSQKFQNLYANVLKNSNVECLKVIATTIHLIIAVI